VTNPLFDGATLHETHDWLFNMSNTLIKQTSQWSLLPAISADTRDRALRLRRKVQLLQGRFGPVWQSVTAQGRQQQGGPDLNDFVGELQGLNTEAAELEREVTGASAAAAVQQPLEFEQAHLRRAITEHQLAALCLMLLLIAGAVAAFWLIVELFGLTDANVRLVAAIPPGETRVGSLPWDHALTIIGGRVALVFLVGWFLSFIARLHRQHVEQIVGYRDRLAGLALVGPVLRFAVGKQRDAAIEQLIRSNLSLEHNAFRDRPRRRKQPGIRDVERILGSLTKALQPFVDSVRRPTDGPR
jgi:hypothetical protein